MPTSQDNAARFLALHHGSAPLLMPNPWDVGSAKLLVALGFEALATTSGGFAAALGRSDGSVTREEAIAHAETIAGSVEVPVSADLEHCFADDPEGVALTVRMAVDAGLAGCSVEDYSQRDDDPIYELGLARERVAAAAEAAHGGSVHTVLTARAEGFLRGRPDLGEIIARLQAYQEAGADVLYAPLLKSIDDIRSVVSSVDRPVNVLAGPDVPPVAVLAAAGVARISVGSAFANVCWAALAAAATELRDLGTYGYSRQAAEGSRAIRAAFAALR